MGGGAASAKTASYTLVAADAGTTISMTSTSATTVTVNTGLFAAGDTVFIQNLGSGNLTITAGTATVATAGSLILPQNDAGILYFVSTSSSVFYDFIQVGAASPLTTKGDLYTFASSDTRLGVGANNTILTADSAEATGLKWATPASAGGMTLISETVASASTGISFTSLGSYKQLLLMYTGLSHSATGSSFSLRFNANSGTVYYSIGFQSRGTTYNAGESAMPHVGGFQTASAFSFGNDSNAAQTAGIGGAILIDNYTSTTKSKTCTDKFGYYDQTANQYVAQDSMMNFDSTAAITSLDITRISGTATLSNNGNSTIRLYGIS
jgi:hypothetical protein